MKEVKVYGSLLFVLMIGSFFSFNRDEKKEVVEERPTLVEATRDTLKSIRFQSRSSTVTVTFRKDDAGKAYSWFEVEQGRRKRGFTANKAGEEFVDGLTPFKALRGLGRLSEEELKDTKLAKPERKLFLNVDAGSKGFDVGGRTSGARDHYVRPQGSQDVYLVASNVLGELEFPESRFMQRKMLTDEMKDIGRVQLAANGKTKVIFHKNRLSPNESFWSSEAAPDELNETLGNFITKLERLAIIDYPAPGETFPREGTPVAIITWYGDDDAKVLNTTELWKAEFDRRTDFFAISPATKVVVRVSKTEADLLAKDLASIMAD